MSTGEAALSTGVDDASTAEVDKALGKSDASTSGSCSLAMSTNTGAREDVTVSGLRFGSLSIDEEAPAVPSSIDIVTTRATLLGSGELQINAELHDLQKRLKRELQSTQEKTVQTSQTTESFEFTEMVDEVVEPMGSSSQDSIGAPVKHKLFTDETESMIIDLFNDDGKQKVPFVNGVKKKVCGLLWMICSMGINRVYHLESRN